MEATVQPRLVQPARQPICCSCGQWKDAKQTRDFTFACPHCHGYVGYCGPNGCDTGVDHVCWKPGDAAPILPTPDYFDYAAHGYATA